ncbi:MAG: hypothetical protein WKF84_21135 [Pyrinomonadaceae bacterium]
MPAAQRPSLQDRRPIQGFGSISSALPAGFSNYHALQAKFERRFARGLYLLNSFTWSKAIDNVGQVLEEPNGNTGTPQNLYDLASDRGISAYDQPINNTTSFVWEVPVGRGRRLGGDLPSIAEAVIGGWTVSGINTMTSGQPINLRYGPSPVTANLPSFLGGVALRPNVSGDPLAPDDERTIDQLFQPQQRLDPECGSAVRQRRPQHRPEQRFLSTRSRRTQELPSPSQRRDAHRVSGGVFQLTQQDQLRRCQFGSLKRSVRNHSQRVPGAANSICAEVLFLTWVRRKGPFLSPARRHY